MKRIRYVSFPNLQITKTETETYVCNPVYRTRLKSSNQLVKLLRGSKKPQTFQELNIKYGVTRKTLQTLEDSYILAKESEVNFLAAGLVNATIPPVGVACERKALLKRANKNSFVILGAPIDIAAGGEGGAKHGPSEVRSAFPNIFNHFGNAPPDSTLLDLDLHKQYDLRDFDVLDIGNIPYSLGEDLDIFGGRLQKVYSEILETGATPIVIGGDHSISKFTLELALKKYPALGIIHFDAHHDMYLFSHQKTNHANPFERILSFPALKILMQIGLRTLETAPRGGIPNPDQRIRYISSYDLYLGNYKKHLASLPRNIPYYLSFDVDCMSPNLATETGTREPGGINYYQGLELLLYLRKRFKFIGADFVEVSHKKNPINTAASIAARYILQFILASLPSKPLQSYRFKHSSTSY